MIIPFFLNIFTISLPCQSGDAAGNSFIAEVTQGPKDKGLIFFLRVSGSTDQSSGHRLASILRKLTGVPADGV